MDIPDEARVLITLVNSRTLAGRPDRLRRGDSAARAFGALGLCDPAVPLGPAAVRALVALRTAIDAVLHQPDDADAWREIDALAQRAAVGLSFAPGPRAGLRARTDSPAAAVLLALHTAITTGSWERIRLCANDVCAAAFYDTTRSRTQRWHSYDRCGNRVNVARYRARTAPRA
jgi:predicted RNA-binding Zn ribbon-like protein